MKKINVAINGFGRIGRAAAKIIINRFPDMNIVAINDLTDAKTLAHLMKYDTCYGCYEKAVTATEKAIVVAGHKIPVLGIKDPALLPWQKLGVDIVLECTGRFNNKEDASLHLKAGAKKVILSAPAKKGGVKTFVVGVNEKKLTSKDDLISCASCTTNCLAPLTMVIGEKFGIQNALMSTVHAFTADQNLVDGPHKDLRRARGAANNIIPTTTGAAISVAEIIPSLKGKFDGMAFRVPVPVGSLCDVTFLLKKKTTVEAVKTEFIKAAKGKLKGILEASNEKLVSSDIVGNSHSSIIDLESTTIVGGNLLKVVAWYDNEWGYSNRFVELAGQVKKFIK